MFLEPKRTNSPKCSLPQTPQIFPWKPGFGIPELSAIPHHKHLGFSSNKERSELEGQRSYPF